MQENGAGCKWGRRAWPGSGSRQLGAMGSTLQQSWAGGRGGALALASLLTLLLPLLVEADYCSISPSHTLCL